MPLITLSELVLLPQVRVGSFTDERRDRWFLLPIVQGFTIIVFLVYSTLSSLIESHHEAHPYVSPYYPPDFIPTDWWVLPASLLTIWAPVGFRATCYYMRKIYFRVFFFSPPGCAVDGISVRRGKYRGERGFPFVLNNLHRFFFYCAIVLACFHWYDVYAATRFEDGFGVGVGTVLLALDALFLTGYVLSCHSCRHLLGGGLDRIGLSRIRSFLHSIWGKISFLNVKHGAFFWLSLLSIMLADIYIRLVSLEIITDLNWVF